MILMKNISRRYRQN